MNLEAKRIVKLLLFIVISFLFISISVSAQDYKHQFKIPKEGLPYKSLSEFENDTIAYLDYNFTKRPYNSYEGMTVREFLNLIDLPYCKII